MAAQPRHYLDFERPIAELEAKIEDLQKASESAGPGAIETEVAALRDRVDVLKRDAYARLDPWQKTLVARHPNRPHFVDYVGALVEDFVELRGDRTFGDDQAIVGGLGRFRGQPVVVIGHEKGFDTASRLKHNFGMARPEGYRKAVRLMDMAEQFGLPVISFIDTAGAYPGVGAEERGQAEAIARSTERCLTLGTPMVATVTGEGGSGGAIAIGVCDRLLMLQYSVYSVISPEGCASILWKSADRRELAAEAMGITAERLSKLDLIDEVLPEPLGGAHREPQLMAERLRDALTRHLSDLTALSTEALLAERARRLRGFGVFGGA
jgi:acetyl-CoA carboxylase carboxyl transferase subunit alpha